ncbi:kinase-like domain-containing protein [Gigaspora rosea]|uniref:Kinase-like domain-containing protein n=1 Tax=Gigaspora rosea TaxID=44941 RepID=A0A397UUP5_9GLOM|nr:kinase-like domain-containing protein [Gigaspora rosea]
MKWEKKLDLLSYIASNLEMIHSHNIIHCDLHSGNIFQDDLNNAYIGDLGFATSINKALVKGSGGLYGVLRYTAPEVLCGNPFTQASDIYSFGMIMWEISSGKVVFPDRKYDDAIFQMDIRGGLRPIILEDTPICFANLLKKCWDQNPEKRPSALEIHKTIIDWKNDKGTLLEFLKSDNSMKANNFTFEISDDNYEIYSSKFINNIRQKMDGMDTSNFVSDNNYIISDNNYIISDNNYIISDS